MAGTIFCVVVVLVLCSTSRSLPVSYQHTQLWNSWKLEHGKNYSTDREDMERHLVWLSNKKYIETHNLYSDVFGFTLAMNQFGDLTDSEFKSHFTPASDGLPPTPPLPPHPTRPPRPTTPPPPPRPPVSINRNYSDIPDFMDWRTMNAVSPVGNEFQCISSFAFAGLGALEGAISLATGKLIKLSPQSLVDCTLPYGNQGCHGGGRVKNAYDYIIANGGVDLDAYYPFTGYQGTCMAAGNPQYGAMTSMVQIPEGDEKALKAAVAFVGPVAAAVDATSKLFRFYKSGVLDVPYWYTQHAVHAVLITGYGIVNDKKYWIARNSWGEYWGNKGFIMLSRDRYNQLGVASNALYPTL